MIIIVNVLCVLYTVSPPFHAPVHNRKHDISRPSYPVSATPTFYDLRIASIGNMNFMLTLQ